MSTNWLYKNNNDNSVRYVLGTKGRKTIFCFGINPSWAEPDNLDPTLKRVESISSHNGYDSWIMFNVYPKRDTYFNNLSYSVNANEHKENISIIKQILKPYDSVDIWVAFGNHLHDRDYLPICLKDIYLSLPKININWFSVGVNKSGAPKHPLYQKAKSILIPFDMDNYIHNLK